MKISTKTGTIVNIASMAGIVTGVREEAIGYYTSKHLQLLNYKHLKLHQFLLKNFLRHDHCVSYALERFLYKLKSS